MKSLLTLIVFLSGILAASAQTPTPIATPLPSLPTTTLLPRGSTTLVLGADVANGVVAPGVGSRIRVPPGDSVLLMAPLEWSYTMQWTKDGQPIPGATGPRLTIPLATTADAGNYNIMGAPWPNICTGALVEVAPIGHLSVLSVRVDLDAGAASQIVGFAVGGKSQKHLLIRAVGPSLAQFGIAKPVALPYLRYYNSRGEFVSTTTGFPPDWNTIFASAGAFPLTGPERSNPVCSTALFAPGAYTVHVSDAAQQGGTVLVEIYELP
jgi:hypothetical protein